MKLSIFTLTVTALGFATATNPNTPKLGLCELDCDEDDQCAPGLLCADRHKNELKAKGFDTRKANCPVSEVPEHAKSEVCFNPDILKPPSGGGGGDPHFRTYDGTKYSYHGQCDLVMATSPSFGNGIGLDLHVRTEIVDSWSLISNAALRIGDDIFELSNDGSFSLNGGNDTDLPLLIAGRYEVKRSEEAADDSVRSLFFIELENDNRITLTLFKHMISVRVDADLDGTHGLLGIHGKVGMIGRDGESVLEDPNEMGAQWQVTNREPFLFRELRAPQYPETCILPTVTSRRLRHSDERKKMAVEACAGVVEHMRSFCFEDVLVTGIDGLAKGYGESF